MSPLKIKIPIKKIGRKRWAEGFNSGVKGLTRPKIVYVIKNIIRKAE
jgi:hypothetical protein